jgi:hypothetical protein
LAEVKLPRSLTWESGLVADLPALVGMKRTGSRVRADPSRSFPLPAAISLSFVLTHLPITCFPAPDFTPSSRHYYRTITVDILISSLPGQGFSSLSHPHNQRARIHCQCAGATPNQPCVFFVACSRANFSSPDSPQPCSLKRSIRYPILRTKRTVLLCTTVTPTGGALFVLHALLRSLHRIHIPSPPT